MCLALIITIIVIVIVIIIVVVILAYADKENIPVIKLPLIMSPHNNNPLKISAHRKTRVLVDCALWVMGNVDRKRSRREKILLLG